MHNTTCIQDRYHADGRFGRLCGLQVPVPKASESFWHDLDGNLLSDSLWTNTWNGENRLIRVQSAPGVSASGARMREEWTHLPDGRWIERIVSTNNGSSYYPAYTNRFVWAGQVLLAILDHTNGLVMSFLRGSDLSGSIQGAGGVGGVLAVNFAPSTLNPQPSTHLVSYDGNGNVAAMHNTVDGSESAVFEYGPFSEPIRVNGPVATLMPLRFSTMYEDNVTGDRKYLFRDFTPSTGRWKSRDPIEEEQRDNLRRRHLTGSPMRFVVNNPINSLDRLGLSTLKLTISYDDSVTDRSSLNRELTWMVLRLTGYLQMCSCDGNGPGVSTALSAETYSKPEDGYYEYNFPFKDPIADSVPVMFTMPPLGPIPALGYAKENRGVVIIAMNEPKIFPDVLAHELGHVAGYVGDLDRYHSKDLNNLMHIPELGQLKLPDKQWCDKVKALAK